MCSCIDSTVVPTDHFLYVSHAQCVNFTITKSKHRKGNFISARCHYLCFEITDMD